LGIAENHPSRPVTGKVTANLPQSAAEGSVQRHADRPTEFDRTDVKTEFSAVIRRQVVFKTVPDRFRPLSGGKKIAGSFSRWPSNLYL